jgi:hypothetical protein
MKIMKFARFILWDMSGAVKSENLTSTHISGVPTVLGLSRAAALNLGSGIVLNTSLKVGQDGAVIEITHV